MIDAIRYPLLNLSRKKFRTWMTILSISVAVASVVLISSVGAIGVQAVNSEIDSLGIGALTVSVNRLSGTKAFLGEEQLDFLQNQSQIKEAVPIVTEKVKIEMRGLSADGMAWGIDSGAKQVFSLDLLYGRLFRKEDIFSATKVCVIDETMAETFYGRKNIVGKSMKVLFNGHYETFDIIGVVSSGGNILQSVIGEYVPSFVYIPYSSMQKAVGKESFDQIALKVTEGTDIDLFGEQIIRRLEEREGVSNAFTAQNIARQKEKLNHILQVVSRILSIIAGISLVVAGLGIMTVMMASVNERTREIGVKKSIGATKYAIVLEFLMESLALSLFGSLIGTSIGLGISWLGCFLLHADFSFERSSVLFAVCFSIANGLIFGAYPSFKAANLKPVDALRYDG